MDKGIGMETEVWLDMKLMLDMGKDPKFGLRLGMWLKFETRDGCTHFPPIIFSLNPQCSVSIPCPVPCPSTSHAISLRPVSCPMSGIMLRAIPRTMSSHKLSHKPAYAYFILQECTILAYLKIKENFASPDLILLHDSDHRMWPLFF